MEKPKSIETEELLIKGNLLCWEDTMVQISNVSCITMTSLATPPFPVFILVLMLGGVALFFFKPIWGIIAVVISIIWLMGWSSECNEISSKKRLNIILNSGNTLAFEIKDQQFLKKVIKILQPILIKGNIGGDKKILINIKNSSITGNVRILNDSIVG